LSFASPDVEIKELFHTKSVIANQLRIGIAKADVVSYCPSLMKFDFSTMSIVLGLAICLFWLPVAAVPARSREWACKLPRNQALGWLFAAICIGWSGYILKISPLLADLPMLRNALVLLMPVAFVLIVIFLNELLAARAFGGLLLLVPRPILDAAFLCMKPAKLYIVVLLYIIVIIGAVLVVSPYLYRRSMQGIMKTDLTARIAGACGIIIGAVAAILGAIVL